MGSGKSYFGKKISEKYNLPYIDLDHYIEDNECQSISDIFKLKGENYFRQLEEITLKKIILLKNKHVIALGGGTPCYKNNMEQIKKNGFVIYLKNEFELLLHRIKNEELSRPLLQHYLTENNIEKLKCLYEERHLIYQQADQILISDFKNLEELSTLILKKYHEK